MVEKRSNTTPDRCGRRRLLEGLGGMVAAGLAGRTVAASVVAASPGSSQFREIATWSPLDHDDEYGTVSELLRPNHDVYVQGDYAYIAYWDAGVWVLDVSDPADPSFVTRVGGFPLEELQENSENPGRHAYQAPGNAHYVAPNPDNTVLAIGAEGWDRPDDDALRGPGGIDLYDVTRIAAPEQVSAITPPKAPDETPRGTWTTAHNFDLANGRLYSSWYDAGVKIHDISDPSDPEQLAWWRSPEQTSFFTAQSVPGRDVFVASAWGRRSADPGLYTFPDRAGRQPDPPSVFDDSPSTTADDASGTQSGTTTTADGEADYGPLGYTDIRGAAEAVVGDDGEFAYVAATDGFAVVDIRDPANPTVVTERRDLVPESGGAALPDIQDVSVDGNVLLVPGPAGRGTPKGFFLYDVSDPTDPRRIDGFHSTATNNHNGFIRGDHVYLTSARLGNPVVIIDRTREATTTSTTTTTSSTTPSTTTTTSTATPTSRSTTPPATTPTTSEPTPGLGVAAGLVGLGAGLWYRLRGRGE